MISMTISIKFLTSKTKKNISFSQMPWNANMETKEKKSPAGRSEALSWHSFSQEEWMAVHSSINKFHIEVIEIKIVKAVIQ